MAPRVVCDARHDSPCSFEFGSPMERPYDCVLLMAYGAPEKMEDVRPFLDNVLRGLPVPKERYEAVVHHYALIGGKSPLNELTNRQAQGLRSWLRAEGLDLPVYVGMRFAKPYMFTAIRDMIRDGRRRAVGIVLAPYRSEPSFEKYQEAVQEVLDAAGPDDAPRVDFIEPWCDHPLFAEAQADEVRRALEKVPEDRRAAARLVFTAHSIPLAVAERCPYVSQIETACGNVSRLLGGRPWQLVWQSRSGNPRTPWLEPDVNVALHALKEEKVADVVLCPIGFISDHVEVRYDLDLEAARTCRDLGLNMVRAGTVNDHPTFIRALGDLVVSKIRSVRVA
jgi:protoporphyrin/coproporphyrin ferrochelatase